MGRRAITVGGDITNPDDVANVKRLVVAQFGDPHIVVLNAVIQYNWVSVLEQPIEDYESQFRSCVLQAVLLAKNFVPAMVERGQGRFIAINTECSLQCFPGQSAYAAGKRGMDGVMRVLAREIGPSGVTVNQVAPGWMISEKYRDTGTQSQPGYEANVPLRHRGEDIDIANAVAFFASDAARFITGAFLPVCGGNVMLGI
jgi:3-oxoacyl-[acyl-carrier protein] reductase